MTEEAGGLVVRLEATIAKFEQQMRRAEGSLRGASRKMSRQADTLDKRLSRVGDAFGVAIPTRAAAAAAAIAGIGVALRSAVRNGEEITKLRGRFEALTGSAERAEAILAGVFATAGDTGAAIADIGNLTAQFGLAADQIGATDQQVAAFTRALVQLGAIGGSSAQEIANGSRQLGQALAGGIVRAEEFNSVLENTPLVAKAIADALGLSLGALRQLVIDGELTSERVFAAILEKADETQRKFQELPPTLERATGRLAASWATFSAEIDRSLGLTDKLIAAVEALQGALATPNAFGFTPPENPIVLPPTFGAPAPAASPPAAPPADAPAASRRRPTGGGRGSSPQAAAEAAATRVIDGLNASIQTVERENILLGEQGAARARLAAQIDIETAKRAVRNAAADAGVAVDERTLATVEALGQVYLDATEALEAQRAAIEAAAEAQRQQQRAAEDAKRAIEGIGDAFTSSIAQADSFEDALKRVALQLLNLGIQGIFGAGPLAGALDGVFSGGASGVTANRNGNVIDAGRVRRFARGGVVSSPTLFAMAGAQTGLMGEAGPEAIMPLKRGADGRLGVAAAGGHVEVLVSLDDDLLNARIVRTSEGVSARAIGRLSAARSESKAVLA